MYNGLMDIYLVCWKLNNSTYHLDEIWDEMTAG